VAQRRVEEASQQRLEARHAEGARVRAAAPARPIGTHGIQLGCPGLPACLPTWQTGVLTEPWMWCGVAGGLPQRVALAQDRGQARAAKAELARRAVLEREESLAGEQALAMAHKAALVSENKAKEVARARQRAVLA
jgi:hypothetical protein